MRIAVVNLTAGGMSGGYRKYLCNILPRMARHDDVEAILCATPDSIGAHDWFDPMPDVIFVPVERNFRFKSVPVVNMIQNIEPFVANSDGNPIDERFRQWVQYVDGSRAIRNAVGIIALSKLVSDFLETQWKIPAEKIGLVYHGIAR